MVRAGWNRAVTIVGRHWSSVAGHSRRTNSRDSPNCSPSHGSENTVEEQQRWALAHLFVVHFEVADGNGLSTTESGLMFWHGSAQIHLYKFAAPHDDPQVLAVS